MNKFSETCKFIIKQAFSDDIRKASYSLILISLTMMVSYGYFYQAGGWNQNSRLDLVRAVIEENSLSIDSFHQNTGDKSILGGHYYSDKAPGQSFLAIPFVAASHLILYLFDIDSNSIQGLTIQAYVAVFFTSIIPTILTALGLYWLVCRMGFGSDAALFTMLVFGFSTPAWGYATLFFPHALAANFLILSFCLIYLHTDIEDSDVCFLICLLAGLFAGMAVLVEYHAGPAAIILAMYLLLHNWISKSHTLTTAISGLFLGGGICLLLLMLYNLMAFGSPFILSYQVKLGFEEMQTGIFGITYPAWESIFQLLFGQYRGLFTVAPVLVGSFFGFLFLFYKKEYRLTGIFLFMICMYFILLHSSFINWHGGWGYGPRYMLPALPFFCLPLAVLWKYAHEYIRATLLGIAFFGVLLNFVAVSVTPQVPQFYLKPYKEIYWPSFINGDFSLNHQTYQEIDIEYPMLRHPEYGRYPKRAAWNVGEKFGLNGHASLLPLYLFWIIMIILFFRNKNNGKLF